ncbi:MAG: hypothetical protein COA45_12085 [Zetaproteobacteria bacterium]|nr:MAG: hypothetical protein COA45_12085 [Zetaproteobacteria bacterium]
MPTFAELKNKYMFTGSITQPSGSSGGLSPTPPTSMSIPIFTQSEVTPLINGPRYFAELKAKLNALDTTKNAFFYIHGWWFGENFSFDGAASPNAATDLLKKRSADGVDVRVMGWVAPPELMNSSLVSSVGGAVMGILGLNNQTMKFIQKLRTEPTMAHKAVCNILSHPAGAAHLKMCVLGDDDQAWSYTGGIDLQGGRHSAAWEDVQVKTTGPGARGVYNYYRDLWQETRGRNVVSLVNPAPGGITMNSHTSSMPSLSARSIGSTTTGKLHVQSGRTLPQYRFASGIIDSAIVPTNDPLSFAPNGMFGIKAMWHKGISGGETYIYIEDQAFWSAEVSDWLNAQIKANSSLKVILVTGRWDPNDPHNPLNFRLRSVSINNHLLAGLTSAQMDRICLVSHQAKTIHAKTTIVDDHWGLIGSANYMRRSLYSDIEGSYGFMDEDATVVSGYRQELWDFHFGAPEPDLTAAIDRWFALPTTTAGLNNLLRLTLPLPPVSLTASEQRIVDEVQDFDSRRVWGADLLSLALEAGSTAISSP